jgi:hypothetical protein
MRSVLDFEPNFLRLEPIFIKLPVLHVDLDFSIVTEAYINFLATIIRWPIASITLKSKNKYSI